MNTLQRFIVSRPGGFLKDVDVRSLVLLDRLHPVLVRCGVCGGRGGGYVRAADTGLLFAYFSKVHRRISVARAADGRGQRLGYSVRRN